MDHKTADLLMGADNPNRPTEEAVRLELIKELSRERDELQSERCELICASRLLNDQLVKQAMAIDTERRLREDLKGVVQRARMILGGAHFERFPGHRINLHPLTVMKTTCPACKVLREMDGGAP